MFTKERLPVFELCSENTELAIRLYCDCINQSKADIFIVMAQKAVCLFRYLLSEGLLRDDINNRYVSSTSIDFDFSNLYGKRIAVVDDIIISGSSISVIIHSLVSNGIEEDNIEIIALARDINYQKMQFRTMNDDVNMLKCALDVEDAESIEISYDLSHILAYNGQQYDADFPVYDTIEVDKNIYKDLINSLDWCIYDITNDVQHLGNVTALVLFPKEDILHELWEKIGINLQSCVHMKIRLYLCNYASGKCTLQVVPMALFNETLESDIDLIFTQLVTDEVLMLSEKWSYEAKMRFLQFYLAHIIQKMIIKQKLHIECILSEQSISVDFGFRCTKSILDCIERISKVTSDIKIHSETLNPDILEYEERFDCWSMAQKNDESGYEINKALYEVIKWWYETQELPARDKLSSTIHYYKDYDFIDNCLNRLRKGFSFSALQRIVIDAEKIFNLEHLVSLFIDRSIDEGFVVPIVYHNQINKCICRAYRHGEDLPFGEADKSRLLYFLKELDKCFRKDNGNVPESISTISFEKMIVLFYQLGLKKGGIFNRFLGFDNDKILQQRFCVHGIVSAINEIKESQNKHHVFISTEKNNDGNSTFMITRILGDYPNEYIKLTNFDGKKNYTINSDKINGYFTNTKLNNISQQIKSDISLIARLIEKWYWIESKSNGKDIFRDNISALTSCGDIYTFASSIATEIHYFKRFWEEEGEQYLKELRQGNMLENYTGSSFDQAMPSARNKHSWYKEERAKKTIDMVGKLFESHDLEYECTVWKELWRRNLKTNLPGSEDLKKLTTKALQFVYFYSECYEWICQQRILECQENSVERKYLEEFLDVSVTDNETNYFEILDKTENEKGLLKRIDYFIDSIEDTIGESEHVVQQIEECLCEKMETYTIRYNSVLIVEIKMTDTKKANKFMRDIWNELPEDTEKTNLNIIHLDSDPHSYQKYGIFHEKSGWNATETLLNLYRSIHLSCCQQARTTKALLIPYLPSKLSFLHNLRSNMQRYSQAFLKQIEEATAVIQSVDCLHQIWLLKNENVSPDLINTVTHLILNLGYSYKKSIDDVKWRRLEFSYDCYTVGEIINSSKHLASTVRIDVNGTGVGTGIMFAYKDKIYCISCQHVLDRCSDNKDIKAVVASNQKKISLKALNYKPLKENQARRTAQEDILILQPNLMLYPDFDQSNFFCEDDCDESLENNCTDEYELFGFGKTSRELGHWEKEMKNSGPVAKGFLQMFSRGKHIEEGDSGSAILSSSTHKLLGIHVRSEKKNNTPNASNTKDSLVIPISNVIKTLKDLRI